MIVAIDAVIGGRQPEAFYSTWAELAAIAVLEVYASRWCIEVTFHDAKPSLGFEQPPGWSDGSAGAAAAQPDGGLVRDRGARS